MESLDALVYGAVTCAYEFGAAIVQAKHVRVAARILAYGGPADRRRPPRRLSRAEVRRRIIEAGLQHYATHFKVAESAIAEILSVMLG